MSIKQKGFKVKYQSISGTWYSAETDVLEAWHLYGSESQSLSITQWLKTGLLTAR